MYAQLYTYLIEYNVKNSIKVLNGYSAGVYYEMVALQCTLVFRPRAAFHSVLQVQTYI